MTIGCAAVHSYKFAARLQNRLAQQKIQGLFENYKKAETPGKQFLSATGR